MRVGGPAGGAAGDAGRFEAVRDGFRRARGALGCAELGFAFAGLPVRLRVAGEALARCVLPPFAHLRAESAGALPQLAVDLWDVRETGVAGLPAADAHAGGRVWDLGDSVLAASADARFVSHEVRGCVAWLDRRGARLVGWCADADGLSVHQRSKPLQLLLALWASDRDLQAVHAGLVGRGGRGVLLPGRSGSGKSTAALACLLDGCAYAGDDWIALERTADGAYVGHGLYGTAVLAPHHAQRFAALPPAPPSPADGPDEKRLLPLSRLVPDRLAAALPVRALALPRVVDRPDCRVRPASRRDALLTTVPSSVFTMSPRGGRRDVQRLFALAAELPAFWLEIGRDLDQIPRRIDEILQAVAQA